MFARIKFDDSFHESFIVDATIENNRVYRNAHMGFEGSINNDLYLFVLLTDGKIDMERLIMELTRLMNADIIHQIYTTTKSKSVNILRCAGKTASLTTTNDDCDHPIFDLTLEACKRLGVIR
jgi:hypothetical protein